MNTDTKSVSSFRKVVVILLSAVAVTPLIYTPHTLYPFIFGKITFFRVLIELAIIVFGVGFLFGEIKINKGKILESVKKPIVIATILFFVSILLSTVFSQNLYRSFWGGMERGGGFFNFLHLFFFLFLTVIIFNGKNWVNFFKVSLVVGFIEIFYGFLQFFRVRNFIFSLPLRERVGSFIENSSFFAAYLFFIIISGVIVWQSSKKTDSEKLGKFWRIFSVSVSILAAVTIFLTKTRGAILGLAAALLFVFIYFAASGKGREMKIKKVSLKKISVILIVLGLVFSIVFISTRTAPVWQKVPGLNRLAKTETLSIKDASTQTRIIVWKSVLEAFKENPVFGWGEENLSLAYNKYYNPDISEYGETWIDRSHNKLIDLMVMRGLIGLAAYLFLFAFVLSKFIKESREKKFVPAVLVSGFLIGYFVQNLFLFDELSCYIMFFALVGFALSRSGSGEYRPGKGGVIPKAAGVILVLVSLFSIYKYNFIPYSQAKAAVVAEFTSADDPERLSGRLNRALHPYTYAQPAIRGHVADYFYNKYFFKPWGSIFASENFEEMSEILLKSLDEAALKTDDPRMYIRQTQIYNEMGKWNVNYYKNAEDKIRKAIEITPKRQELYYQLGIALSGQSRFEEGLEAAKQAVELSPGVSRAHYHLGLMYAIAGYREPALDELAKAEELNSEFRNFISADIRGMVIIYSGLGETGKMSEVILRISKRELSSNIEEEYYNRAVYYYFQNRDKDNMITVLEGLKRAYPYTTDSVDVLIDLAIKEKWEILDNIIVYH